MEKSNGLVVSLTSPEFANCHYAIISEILVRHSTIIRYSSNDSAYDGCGVARFEDGWINKETL